MRRPPELGLILGLILGLNLVLAESPPSSSLQTVRSVSGCVKVTDCKCLLWDGGGVISLDSLEDEQGFLEHYRPVLVQDQLSTELLFSFSPCRPFSQPEQLISSDCTDVAACLIIRSKRHANRYLNYGRHEGNQFHYNESTKTLSVSYSVFSEVQTVVHYHCSPNRSTSISLSLQHHTPLQMWVESPCACPNACTLVDVGPGTIFLIILCLSITAYFILGSCALRPFRSSSGVQISPEDSVWCMICYHFTEQPNTKRKRYSSLREETL